MSDKQLDQIIKKSFELTESISESKIVEIAQQILDICQPKWIPVTDRLPEYQAQVNGERVAYVFVSVNGLTGCAEYNEGKFQFMSVPDAPVTHWMPLFPPPEDTA